MTVVRALAVIAREVLTRRCVFTRRWDFAFLATGVTLVVTVVVALTVPALLVVVIVFVVLAGVGAASAGVAIKPRAAIDASSR